LKELKIIKKPDRWWPGFGFFGNLDYLYFFSSQLILDAYLAWLRYHRSRTLPKSLLGQAIAYSLNQWDKMASFLMDGRLEIDNNRIERWWVLFELALQR
jgi:hypothetical protein